MRKIRQLVYKLGVRPKPESIFYSPSLAFHLIMKEAFENDSTDMTIQEVYDSLTDLQREVVHYIVGISLTGVVK